MEVRKEKTGDGREVFRFISTARTSGMVDSIYPVRDTVQSLVDSRTMASLSYNLDQSHGRRKKQRHLLFDHEALFRSEVDGARRRRNDGLGA